MKIDLIIMGTHGVSGYRELFIGSNAQRVVTLSEIPVLTLWKKKIEKGFSNILVPVDNSLHSREKVNIAAGLAKIYGAKIHLLGLPDLTEKKDLNKFRIKLDSVEGIIKRENITYEVEVIPTGNTAKAAMSYANDNDCDLIVINTGHESKITGIFLGAFAQQIVNHSNIPVLSVKPRHGDYEDVSLIGSPNPYLN